MILTIMLAKIKELNAVQSEIRLITIIIDLQLHRSAIEFFFMESEKCFLCLFLLLLFWGEWKFLGAGFEKNTKSFYRVQFDANREFLSTW